MKSSSSPSGSSKRRKQSSASGSERKDRSPDERKSSDAKAPSDAGSDTGSQKSGTSSSSKTSKKSSTSKGPRNNDEQGEMLTKDKAEQAQRMLETVEGVLQHIADEGLTGAAAVEYILDSSVDVQRIATLQQLQNHVDAADRVDTQRVLDSVLTKAPEFAPAVQIAATEGITRILSTLPQDLCHTLVNGISPLLGKREPATPTSTPRKRDGREIPGLGAPMMAATDGSPEGGVDADAGGGEKAAEDEEVPPTPPQQLCNSPVAGPSLEAQNAWKQLFHAALRRIPANEMDQVLLEHVLWRFEDTVSSGEKVFGVETLQVVIGQCPEAGTLMMRCLMILSSDASARVRLAAVRGMPTLFEVALPVAIREQLLMPLLTLLADTDLDVACAAFESMIETPRYVGLQFTRDIVRPILKQFITNAPGTVLECVMSNYGRLVWNLKDAFDPLPEEARALLKTNTGSSMRGSMRMSKSGQGKSGVDLAASGQARSISPQSPRNQHSLGVSDGTSVNLLRGSHSSLSAQISSPFAPIAAAHGSCDWVFVFAEFLKHSASADPVIRRACAFNAPAMMASVPEDLRNDLFACVALLAKDTTAKVRICVAAGFHELCHFSQDPVKQILPTVTSLASDTNIQVKEHFFRNVTEIFSTVKRSLVTQVKAEAFFGSVTPLIISYEKEIHTNWRKVAVLIRHMQLFGDWFSSNDLFSKYVPLLVSHLVSGAAALNVQVCKTIALFLRRSFATIDDCVRVLIAVKNMTAVLSRNKAAAGRMGFVSLFAEMSKNFSQEFVKAMLLPAFVPLAVDKVPNVRCAVARIVPQLRVYPLMAAQVEKAVLSPLKDDKDPDVRRLIAEGEVLTASMVGFSPSQNAKLLKEEGPQLLSSEAIRKATEALEAAALKAPPASMMSRTRAKR